MTLKHRAVTPRLALALSLFAAPVAADWRFDPAGTEYGGWAVGPGTAGLSVIVDCGNGGFPAVLIDGFDPDVPEDIFVLGVDRRDEFLLPASCNAGQCLLEIETMEDAGRLLRDLAQGSLLNVGLYRRGMIAEVSLRGSADAINRMAADRQCEMP